MSINILRLDQLLKTLDPDCEIFSLDNAKLITSKKLTEQLIYSLIPQNWDVTEHANQNIGPPTRTFLISSNCPDYEILKFFTPSEEE